MTNQHVFISHSRKNREFVDRLTADLEQKGVRTWIDQHNLTPGTRNWEDAIRAAIRGASAFLLIATPDSRRSNFVQDEVTIAELEGCQIYPLWAAGDNWMDAIPMGMGKMQYIDARDERYVAALDDLVTILHTEKSPFTERPAKAAIPPNFVPRNPYKGLQPFREADQADFFGRNQLIEDILDRLTGLLQGQNDRFLAVLGPSGAGKSSVVMAGILPLLRQGRLSGSAHWSYVAPMYLGQSPVENLAIELSNVLRDKSQTLIRQELDSPNRRGLHIVCKQIVGTSEGHVLLFIDQFEELFGPSVSEQERSQFIDLLLTAVAEPHGPLIVLLTMRADFYDKPMNYAHLGQLFEKQNHVVLPMSVFDLRQVIEKPAHLPDVQLTFDEGLVSDLVFEVRDHDGALPLLQFTLSQLFDKRQERRLCKAAYDEMGGVVGALAKYADQIYSTLPSDRHCDMARFLFLRLVELENLEVETTRRRVSLDELVLDNAEDSRILAETLDIFVKARLLVSNQQAGIRMIEIAHEALLRRWERLTTWLHTAREELKFRSILHSDVNEWTLRKKPSDMLYRGVLLDDALAWSKRNIANHAELEFINASLAAQEKRYLEEKRIAGRLKYLRWATGFLTVIFLTALFGSVAFGTQAQDAKKDRDRLVDQGKTAEWESTFFGLQQQNAQTVVAGVGIFPFANQTLDPQAFFATRTKVAALAQLTPIIEDFDAIDMVFVPAGCFLMGSALTVDASPHEQCFDQPFWIDRFEVSNAQFDRYFRGENPAETIWADPDQPRTFVTWFEAVRYCSERGALTYLPNEAEWEYAARGPNSNLYPWGPDFIADYVVYNAEGPAPIQSNPEGASWVGAYHMSGNAYEWTSTIYDPERFTYPYDAQDGRENPDDVESFRVLRGGSWGIQLSDRLRLSNRDPDSPYQSNDYIGFRCARRAGG